MLLCDWFYDVCFSYLFFFASYFSPTYTHSNKTMSTTNYEMILKTKLLTAQLYDILNVFQNATNTNTTALINEDVEKTQNLLNTQIVDRFIDILKEVKKLKAEAENKAHDQFVSELANDVAFDIPEVFSNDDDGDTDTKVNSDDSKQNDANSQPNEDASAPEVEVLAVEEPAVEEPASDIPAPEITSNSDEKDKDNEEANEKEKEEEIPQTGIVIGQSCMNLAAALSDTVSPKA
eukprot:352444_1